MTFKPHISSESKVPEFTIRAVILGIILGLVFAVGNAYLGLKVGTTVSASIPAAVLSMAILKAFFKRVSILENNLVQTIASVGEALAAGVIFTVPALFLLGAPPAPSRIFMLALLGGVLGVLFMIPMRRYLIVQEHGKLPFPEGTACAEILKTAESNNPKALLAGVGILVGAVYKICCSGFYLWNEVTTWVLKPFQKTEVSIDCTPALLGVGVIIGPRISSLLFCGGAIAWWVIIPLVKLFAAGSSAIIYPGQIPVSQMSSEDVWSNYVRYIGAGTILTGGILSLFKIAPLIGKTLKIGFGELFQSSTRKRNIPRTDQDISLRYLFLGSLAILLFLWLFPGLPMNLLTICILVLLGFFFVAVTSLTVGIVGSTSNPVSGMTITTLLITCLIFVVLGWTERAYLIAALTMAVVANVAICLGATTSQDLKAGYILGATPRIQQIGEIIGLVVPSLALGGTLFLLNTAYGFGSSKMPAPQGTMMALVAQGVIEGNIPLTLVTIGVIIGLMLELLRIPILPFAIGLYLPLSLSTGIMFGGLTSACIYAISKSEKVKEYGILAASGLVAGDAVMGVIIAFLTVIGWIPASAHGKLPNFFSLAFFVILAILFVWSCFKAQKKFSS